MKYWIRCTFWCDAGSRTIENKFKGVFYPFLAPADLNNLPEIAPDPKYLIKV